MKKVERRAKHPEPQTAPPVYWVRYEVGEARVEMPKTEIYSTARREFQGLREIRDVTRAFLFRQDIPGYTTLVDEYRRPTEAQRAANIEHSLRQLNTKRILRQLIADLRAEDNDFTTRVIFRQLIELHGEDYVREVLDEETDQ